MVPATEKYLTSEELHQFAKEVYDRFNNPRVRHELMSIALNSSAKFKSRLLPTALDMWRDLVNSRKIWRSH